MRKLSALIVILASLFSSSFAQTEIEWSRNLGGSGLDKSNAAQETSDGGYIIAGYSSSNNIDVGENNGDLDYWIVKVDTAGRIEWERNFGGSLLEEARDIQQTADGGYIVAGPSKSSDKDVGGNNGDFDYWVVKLGAAGDLEWQKNLGGSGVDELSAIDQTADLGYILAGRSNSNDGDVGGNNGEFDFWIVKLNAAGELDWERHYGGAGLEEAHDVRQTADGGYIIAGNSESRDQDVKNNYGDFDFWVVKLSPTGLREWEKNFGGSGLDVAQAVRQTTDGGYIVAGHTKSSDQDVTDHRGDFDYWVAKLNPQGGLEWQRSLGGSDSDDAYALEQTNDGGYIIAGHSKSRDRDVGGHIGDFDYWIVKLTPQGELQWEQNFGGTGIEEIRSIERTDDRGYILAGHSKSTNRDVGRNFGDFDYWIVKLRPCPSYMTTLDVLVCPGDTPPQPDTLLTYFGCDSIITYNIIELPQADAGVDQLICESNTLIEASVLGDTISGRWSGNPGGLLSSENEQIRIDNLNPGNNQFVWTISHPSCPNYDRDTVNVVYLTPPKAEAGIDSTVCTAEIQLGAQLLSDSISGTWSSDDAELRFSDETQADASVSQLQPGVNRLFWTTSHPACPDYDRDTVRIEYLAVPQADAGADIDVCEPEAQLNALALGDTISGRWTSNAPNVVFSDESRPGAVVDELVPGGNPFIWTVSHPVCPNYDQDTLLVTYYLVPQADAGADSALCKPAVQLGALALNDSISGRWTSSLPEVVFSDESHSDAVADGLIPGLNPFIWTTSHPVCPDYDRDTVLISYLRVPDANAGTDIAVCKPEAQLNALALGDTISGRWTSNAPNVVFSDESRPGAVVDELVPGVNQFVWTVSHPVCPDYDRDTLRATYLLVPEARAGADMLVCKSDVTLETLAIEDTISGRWTSNASDVIFSDQGLPNPTVSNLSPGATQLIWTLSHPACPDYDRDSLTVFRLPEADAGPDITVCKPEALLDALDLGSSTTGRWTSGNPDIVFSDQANSSAAISGLSRGKNRLIWTVSHPECPDYSQDDVFVLFDEIDIKAEDDEYTYISDTLIANILENDIFSNSNAFEVEIINKSVNGDVGELKLSPEGRLTFYSEPTAAISVDFRYRISHKSCPEQYAEANVSIALSEYKNLTKTENNNLSLVFTPNGDGSNDVFILPVLEERPQDFPDNNLVVINRWGLIVYEADSYANNWDGTHYKTGKKLPVGTYFFIARLDIGNGDILEGKVTLIR